MFSLFISRKGYRGIRGRCSGRGNVLIYVYKTKGYPLRARDVASHKVPVADFLQKGVILTISVYLSVKAQIS